jgi:hypothetical protein
MAIDTPTSPAEPKPLVYRAQSYVETLHGAGIQSSTQARALQYANEFVKTAVQPPPPAKKKQQSSSIDYGTGATQASTSNDRKYLKPEEWEPNAIHVQTGMFSFLKEGKFVATSVLEAASTHTEHSRHSPYITQQATTPEHPINPLNPGLNT